MLLLKHDSSNVNPYKSIPGLYDSPLKCFDC